MTTSQKARLTEGSVARTLVNLTIPMLLGLVGLAAFNLVDTYFVGQLGIKELAAMSFTFPVVMIVGSVAQGLGVGVSAVVSRAIGEGNERQVQRLTTDGLLLSVLVVVVLVVIGIATIGPVFQFLGASPEVLPLVGQYMRIWYLGVIAVVIPMVGNSAIRATGDTKTPSLVMLVAVVVNIILDPLLIFGLGPFPRLGLVGAALATVIARSITLFVSLSVLYYRDKMITFVVPKAREILRSWKQTLYIGLPNAAANMLIPLSAAIVTRLVAGYGPAAVAGFGVATRIQTFGLLVVVALVSVLSPFVGQNWGAKKYERAEQGVKYSEQFSLGWGLALVILFAIIGQPLATVFTDDPAVVSTVAIYFLIVPISYGLNGVFRISSTVMSVLNEPLRSALLSFAQTFALYVPLAFLGSEFFGLTGIFAAASLSFVISGIAGHFWLKKTLAESMDYDYLQRIVQIQDIGDRPASVGYWIARLQGQARNYFTNTLSKYHFDTRTLSFLTALLHEDGLSQRELSEKLLVNEAVTRRSVSTLVDLGYVRREADRENSGHDLVFVTQKAREISPEVKMVLQSWSTMLTQGFTEEERSAVLTLLQRMHANAVNGLS